MEKIYLAILVVAAVLAGIGTACAVDSPPAFQISKLYASAATNYHFRVWSSTPSVALCTGGPTNPSWAYVNESDSGAKAKISTLTVAYAMGKTVELVTEAIGSYCHILDVNIGD